MQNMRKIGQRHVYIWDGLFIKAFECQCTYRLQHSIINRCRKATLLDWINYCHGLLYRSI